MNEQNKKEIFDLTEQEFYYYFEQEIIPKIQNINYFQINLAKRIQLFLVFIAFILFFSIPFLKEFSFIFSDTGGRTLSQIMPLLISKLPAITPVFLICLMFFIFFVGFVRSKNSVKEDVLNLLGLNYVEALIPIPLSAFSETYAYSKLLKETFFLGYKNPKLDDIIEGNYKGVPFTIIDVPDKSDSKYPHKIFLATKIKKNFNGQLTVFKKDRNLISQFNNMNFSQTVNLEDINFSKEYRVFAENQVEARYLLTTAFMERLLSYKKQKTCDIEVIFSQKYQKFGNLFFCVSGFQDMFELPDGDLKYISQNPKFFYNILLDIKDIMEIVNALKLDQDIGM